MMNKQYKKLKHNQKNDRELSNIFYIMYQYVKDFIINQTIHIKKKYTYIHTLIVFFLILFIY